MYCILPSVYRILADYDHISYNISMSIMSIYSAVPGLEGIVPDPATDSATDPDSAA